MKVLVVEDDSNIRQVLKQLVETAGFQAVLASSLTQARYLFINDTPELYLCAIVDYALPDAQHGEAVKDLIDAYIPTIVMVDEDKPDVRRAMFAMDVVDYFPKGNVQVYDYISRLLIRLEKNRSVAIGVLEPDDRQRKKLCSILARYNFDVYPFNDAQKVAESIELHKISLLLVSEKASEGQGVALVPRLRQSFNKDRLAIIGMANGGQDGKSAQFIKNGANDYIIRPFSIEELLCRVQLNVVNAELFHALNEAAHTDWLTGIYNRRYFFLCAPELMAKHSDTMVALLDIDHFKVVNDSYGHDAGDAALKAIAGQLKLLSSHGMVARMGGEEFCLLLRGKMSECEPLLEQLRVQISQQDIRFGEQIFRCTVSIGVAKVSNQGLDAAIQHADKLLYQAKSAGRNCIKMEQS